MSYATQAMPAAHLGAIPTISREGIRWHGGVDGPLHVELRFANPGRTPSSPATARIGIAKFGAFLPWRPLATVSVPAIPPEGRVVVTATAGGDPLRPTGLAGPAAPAAGRPVQLLLFPGLPEPAVLARPRRFVDFPGTRFGARLRAAQGLEPVHFVGNLNVFVTRSAPVERHVQRAIGLQAGAANVTSFFVGDGRPDTYTFRLEAEPGWGVEIESASWDQPIAADSVKVRACIRPPAKAESGRVAIHVRRGSTGEEVPVEFELETRAPGARCYTF